MHAVAEYVGDHVLFAFRTVTDSCLQDRIKRTTCI